MSAHALCLHCRRPWTGQPGHPCLAGVAADATALADAVERLIAIEEARLAEEEVQQPVDGADAPSLDMDAPR